MTVRSRPPPWPAGEAWPRAVYGWRPDRTLNTEPLPLIPVTRSWVRDLPDLPHPPGADLLQVLWTAGFDEIGYERAMPRSVDENLEVRWRTAAVITEPLTEPPHPDPRDVVLEDADTPVPCALRPERVNEYPPAWMLG